MPLAIENAVEEVREPLTQEMMEMRLVFDFNRVLVDKMIEIYVNIR